jgi:hypothetical protein
MLLLGFLIAWLVAGMLVNVWLTPNQSIAVGAIIALVIIVFFATAPRTGKGLLSRKEALSGVAGTAIS